MIITKIEPQKKHKNRSSVFLDGKFAFGISDFNLHRLRLKMNAEISEKQLDAIRQEIIEEDAKQYALRLLDRHAYTEAMLRHKMKEREFDENSIAYTVNFLKEYGYLNDLDYAERYIAAALKSGKSGMKKIKYDLLGKGIGREIIEEAAGKFEEEQNKSEQEALVKLMKKKLNGDYSYPSLMKAKRYGYARGFSNEAIDIALKSIQNEEEWLDA